MSNPIRERALGLGVNALIPADPEAQTPVARARAALAAVQTAQVPLVVLDGIVGLLAELEQQADDEETQHAAREAVDYLRALTG
ncbi:hypothetical protein [Streptomyces aureoversilis]|uniref:Uncharacterized protein n=1 Tax=Streptomyces aureoversilis TaxID=67277 RepID=A0ABV9ZQN9_9ACTN